MKCKMVVKNTWPSHCPWLEDLGKEDAQEWAVEHTVLACQMEYADNSMALLSYRDCSSVLSAPKR